MATVSVIIPTYNRSKELRDCVDSVLRGTYCDLEVIIVDNASSDSTAEDCAARYAARIEAGTVKYLRLPENRLAAGGRNAGITHATGAYLLFLDNDNIVGERMIEVLVNTLEANPDIGLAGPLSIQADDNSVWTLGSDYNFITSMPKNLHEGERIENIELKPLYPTRYSPNASMITRAALAKAAAFDPFYMAMYEEADFGFRITADGTKGVICSEARTLHLGAVGAGQQSALRRLGIETPMRAYYFARNRSVFMRRFAPRYGLVLFFLFFAHLFTVYYALTALRHKRADIARAYVKGAFKGIFTALFKMPPLPNQFT